MSAATGVFIAGVLYLSACTTCVCWFGTNTADGGNARSTSPETASLVARAAPSATDVLPSAASSTKHGAFAGENPLHTAAAAAAAVTAALVNALSAEVTFRSPGAA